MGAVAYQIKETIQLRLNVGDNLVNMVDMACNTACMTLDKLEDFTITEIEMVAPGVVELTLIYIHNED